jgi:chromosome segregation ATPase
MLLVQNIKSVEENQYLTRELGKSKVESKDYREQLVSAKRDIEKRSVLLASVEQKQKSQLIELQTLSQKYEEVSNQLEQKDKVILNLKDEIGQMQGDMEQKSSLL